jgi:hypothetical protein
MGTISLREPAEYRAARATTVPFMRPVASREA